MFRKAKPKFFIISLVFFGPLFLFMLVWTFYSNRNLRQKIIESNFETLRVYCDQMENSVSQMQYSMSNIMANDDSFQGILYPLSELDAYLNMYNLQEKMKAMIRASSNIDALFIYLDDFELCAEAYSNEMTAIEKGEFTVYMREHATELGEREPGFHVFDVEGTYYTGIVMRFKEAYVICALNLNHRSFVDDKNQYLFFTDGQKALSLEDQVSEIGFAFSDQKTASYRSGEKYLVVQEYLEELDIYGVYAFPYDKMLTINGETKVWVGAVVLFVVLLILYFRLLADSFLKPLQQMLSGIENIDSNESSLKMTIDSTLEEFTIITAAFNKMLLRIKELRILAYDKEIESQKAELQYYEIQIRPHFFLNCLKSIYGMAESGQYENIQNMIIELSKYLRNILSAHEELIPLKKELESAEEYLKIQQICSALPPSYDCEVNADIDHIQIPALSILTFVENSVQYASKDGKPVHISVKVNVLQDEEKWMLNIVIKDNGIGFSEEMLKYFNAGNFDNMKEHIGISNVMHRFSIVYGGEAIFLYQNQRGARVEIFIPM